MIDDAKNKLTMIDGRYPINPTFDQQLIAKGTFYFCTNRVKEFLFNCIGTKNIDEDEEGLSRCGTISTTCLIGSYDQTKPKPICTKKESWPWRKTCRAHTPLSKPIESTSIFTWLSTHETMRCRHFLEHLSVDSNWTFGRKIRATIRSQDSDALPVGCSADVVVKVTTTLWTTVTTVLVESVMFCADCLLLLLPLRTRILKEVVLHLELVLVPLQSQ